ncbi:hypothetical protein N9937_01780 [bacterium]|nr:hypothetical protein [bacterium]
MATSVGTVTFQEQSNSPQITRSAEGVVTIRRTYQGETITGTKTGEKVQDFIDAHPVGEADLLNPLCLLEPVQGTDVSRFGRVTLTYRGGLTAFVEFKNSPQRRQKEDGSWLIPRRYIGPIDQLDSFIASFNRGDTDPTFAAATLRTKTGQPDGVALGIAELQYDGVIEASDVGTVDDKQVSRNYLRSSVTFSPWSKGGFQSGPQVTGTYYSETVTVNYSKTSEPSSPSQQGELSNGSKTFIFEWTPSSFDPACAPHNLEKVKIVTNFHTENQVGTNLYRVSETHQWIIREAPAEGDYDPDG